MTPPRKTAELPGTSVIRSPMSPPLLASARARVRPRSARRRTTASADGPLGLSLCLEPFNAESDRLPYRYLRFPAQLALDLRGVEDVVLGQGQGAEAGHGGPPAASGEPRPRLAERAVEVDGPERQRAARRADADLLRHGGKELAPGQRLRPQVVHLPDRFLAGGRQDAGFGQIAGVDAVPAPLRPAHVDGPSGSQIGQDLRDDGPVPLAEDQGGPHRRELDAGAVVVIPGDPLRRELRALVIVPGRWLLLQGKVFADGNALQLFSRGVDGVSADVQEARHAGGAGSLEHVPGALNRSGGEGAPWTPI